MRLGQIRSKGSIVAAVFEDDGAHQIPAHSSYDLIRRAAAESISLNELAHNLASRAADPSPADSAGSSAGSVGLRLYLRNERLIPRRGAWHSRRYVRLCLP